MYKFSGNVNGTQYDTLEEYNKAITEAMEKQQPISASYQTEMVTDETEIPSEKQLDDPNTHCETSKLCDFNKKLCRFDLDQLNGTSDDDKIMNEFIDKTNPEKAKELAKTAKESLSETEQSVFVNNIRKHIAKIDADRKYNIEALQTAQSEVNNAFVTVGQLQKKLTAAKESLEKSKSHLNILKHADEILQAESEFYNATIKKIPDTQKPVETSCKECNPQQEKSLWDSQFPQYNREHVKNFLKELFDF